MFARGVVSTEAPELGASFTPDGKTIYFNRLADDRSSIVIMRSDFVDGAWQRPDTAAFSGEWFDVDPFVSPDGKKLYYNSDRPRFEADTVDGFNAFVVELHGGEAGDPRYLPEPINSDSSDVFVSSTASGALYFSSKRDGVRRIYRASNDGPDAEVTLVEIDRNLEGGAGNPAISKDEKYLVFAADSETGDKSDIYIASLSDGVWSSSRALDAPVNTTHTEFAPGWSPDGAYLYFTSERPGIAGPRLDGSRPPGDIYRVLFESVVGK